MANAEGLALEIGSPTMPSMALCDVAAGWARCGPDDVAMIERAIECARNASIPFDRDRALVDVARVVLAGTQRLECALNTLERVAGEISDLRTRNAVRFDLVTKIIAPGKASEEIPNEERILLGESVVSRIETPELRSWALMRMAAATHETDPAYAERAWQDATEAFETVGSSLDRSEVLLGRAEALADWQPANAVERAQVGRGSNGNIQTAPPASSQRHAREDRHGGGADKP